MKRNRNDIDARLTRILLAIEVHGPSEIYRHMDALLWLSRNYQHGFQQIRQVLLENGMDRLDVLDMLDEPHESDCACWRCIMRLHNSVVKWRAIREADNA